MTVPLLGLLDCHYHGDDAGSRRTWGADPPGSRARLEERLGRKFNRELARDLQCREVPYRRFSSDSDLPTSVGASHKAKVERVLGHDPVPDVCVEVHFNRSPANKEGVHVQCRADHAPSRQLARLIARGMADGLHRWKPFPIILHPDERYRESGLFGMLGAHSVGMVLVEAGSLEHDEIRESLVSGGLWWTGFLHGIASAMQTWSEAMASGLWEDGG